MFTLVSVGIELLKKYLVKALALNKIFQTVVSLVLEMGLQVYLVYTDNIADNKMQLKEIWKSNFIPLLSGVLAGSTMAIKDQAHKTQIIAILEETLYKLKNDEPTITEI